MTPKRARIWRMMTGLLLALWLTIPAAVAAERRSEPSGYNSDYVYAATRGVNDMDIHPGLKITLVPVTLVLDTAFLPFAVVMGFFG